MEKAVPIPINVPPQITWEIKNFFEQKEEQKEVQIGTDPQPKMTISESIQKLPCSLVPIDSKLDIIEKINKVREEEPTLFKSFEKVIENDLSSIKHDASRAIKTSSLSAFDKFTLDKNIEDMVQSIITKQNAFFKDHLYRLYQIQVQTA